MRALREPQSHRLASPLLSSPLICDLRGSSSGRIPLLKPSQASGLQRSSPYRGAEIFPRAAPRTAHAPRIGSQPNVCCLLCCAVLCCAVLCCAVLCCAVLCCAVLCCAVLCCAVLCCAVLWCAVLCCAVLWCAGRRGAEQQTARLGSARLLTRHVTTRCDARHRALLITRNNHPPLSSPLLSVRLVAVAVSVSYSFCYALRAARPLRLASPAAATRAHTHKLSAAAADRIGSDFISSHCNETNIFTPRHIQYISNSTYCTYHTSEYSTVTLHSLHTVLALEIPAFIRQVSASATATATTPSEAPQRT